MQICIAKPLGPKLHLFFVPNRTQKSSFSQVCVPYRSQAFGSPRLAAGFMLGPSFWLDLPKLLLQLVVKISILCRVILMDPTTSPPVLSCLFSPHLTVGCSTLLLGFEAHGSVWGQSRTIPIADAAQITPDTLAPASPKLQCQVQKC